MNHQHRELVRGDRGGGFRRGSKLIVDSEPCRGVDVKGYRKPSEYPYEAFVQTALEEHFSRSGYRISRSNSADLICERPGERWIIEAKGATSAVGLDFRTGLGQIVVAMQDGASTYAIAIPDIPAFRRQAEKVTVQVRRALNLHVIYVDEAGRVDID
jgi:hypothetical protein